MANVQGDCGVRRGRSMKRRLSCAGRGRAGMAQRIRTATRACGRCVASFKGTKYNLHTLNRAIFNFAERPFNCPRATRCVCHFCSPRPARSLPFVARTCGAPSAPLLPTLEWIFGSTRDLPRFNILESARAQRTTHISRALFLQVHIGQLSAPAASSHGRADI